MLKKFFFLLYHFFICKVIKTNSKKSYQIGDSKIGNVSKIFFKNHFYPLLNVIFPQKWISLSNLIFFNIVYQFELYVL